MDSIDLCMGCMNDKKGAQICPHCGWVEGTPPELPQYLAPGSLLSERYLVGRVLGYGGFGITYLGYDLILNSKLAIKEYLPQSVATRVLGSTTVSAFNTGDAQENFAYGLKKFLDEARALAQFMDHPGVVNVRDFFPANGTAYLVMQYIEGITFKEYLQEKGGRLSLDKALGIMLPALDALREVHSRSLLHRDISPDNIYIMTNGQVKLLDFGAARYAVGEQSKSLSVILKAGYAPEEQYRTRGEQGPWTDVYAAAATLYRALAGKVPPESLDRMFNDNLEPPSQLGVDISPAAEAALLKGLAVRAEDRFQSIQDFQEALMTQGDTVVSAVQVSDPQEALTGAGQAGAARETAAPAPPLLSSSTPAPPSPPNPPVAIPSSTPATMGPGSGLYVGPPGTPMPQKKSRPWGKILIGVGVLVVLALVGFVGLFMSMAHTNGHLSNADGSQYDGNLAWGVPQGQGVMTYSSGENYDGEFKSGKRNGYGKQTLSDGSVYEGEWQDDQRQGSGTLTMKDGTRYKGNWLAGQLNGQATITSTNGRKYTGEVKNDKAEGKGVLVLPDGTKYEGDWANDYPNGSGVYTYPNGNRYEGQVKDDKYEGHGVLTYANGDRYEGEFREGKITGQGTGTFSDGTVLTGQWQDSKYVGP
ncbi:MAG TPA: protein kinase [Syntrophomonadaceae bacterium]|nr:protein kinase [Syntrophomonadaceae bacterium]